MKGCPARFSGPTRLRKARLAAAALSPASIQSFPSTFQKAFSHILAQKSCGSGGSGLQTARARMQGAEINKVSRLSIFPAGGGGAFLRRARGGGGLVSAFKSLVTDP